MLLKMSQCISNHVLFRITAKLFINFIEGHGIIFRSIWDVADELITGQLQHILPEYWQDADVWAVYPSRLKSSSKLQNPAFCLFKTNCSIV